MIACFCIFYAGSCLHPNYLGHRHYIRPIGVTPAESCPMVLPAFYAILRSIPNKLMGLRAVRLDRYPRLPAWLDTSRVSRALPAAVQQFFGCS